MEDLAKSIEANIRDTFDCTHIVVENESHQHNVPKNSQTHFKIIVVSDDFDGKRLVQRHRMLYKLLDEELKNGVHALALHLFSGSEWQTNRLEKQKLAQSPQCRGGMKSER